MKIIFVIHCINTLMYKYTIHWKYVDDTTLGESVSKNETSYMQLRVDELVRQSEADMVSNSASLNVKNREYHSLDQEVL